MISSASVALDALGPGVPGEDVPLGVEQEDGVVGSTVDEDASCSASCFVCCLSSNSSTNPRTFDGE